MRGIKNFQEFIRNGIVKKQSPDKSRAEFLIKSSDNSYKVLLKMIETLDVTKTTANDFVKVCYDLLMQVIRARMLLDGYNASGFGAHEAEISYLRLLGFSEKEVQFANQLRYFRNGMLYYGTQLDKEYALIVIEFTEKKL